MRDDADTADYSDSPIADENAPAPTADPEAYEQDSPGDSDTAQAGEEYTEQDGGEDLVAGERVQGTDEREAIPEPDAGVSSSARRSRQPAVALSETHPPVLFSPGRTALPGSHAVRPIIPWKVATWKKASLARVGPTKKAQAARWEQFYDIAKPKRREPDPSNPGQSRTVTNDWGLKTAAEKEGGIRTDLGFSQDIKDGAKEGGPLPSPRRYRNELLLFFTTYRGVGRNVTPWNEPQLGKNRTRENPYRAARYWMAAQRVCKPYNGGPERCTGEVLAGDYAGTSGDVTWTAKYRDKYEQKQSRRRGWEATYRDYLYSTVKASRQKGVPKRRKLHRPRVWAFHAYEDLKRRALIRKGNDAQGPPAARRTPVLEHYYREFSKDIYRYGSNGKPVDVWITAVGSPYKQKCPLSKAYSLSAYRVGSK